MDQSALSARQADRAHIQGMLNVAFTRARDEVHIYHTAAINDFGMASGGGAIREWLEHCDRTDKNSAPTVNQVEHAQSEFEAQVIQELSRRGIKTISQYPSCGYFIDVVAETDGRRVAIECDGEVWHLDEHGNLKLEDVQRQEVLERAGWTVLRVPYRGWLANKGQHLDRVLDALLPPESEISETTETAPPDGGASLTVSSFEAAIISAMKAGSKERESVLRSALEPLARSRLTPKLRGILENAIEKLEHRKLVLREDGELFLAEGARGMSFLPHDPPSEQPFRHRRGRLPRYYRRYGRR